MIIRKVPALFSSPIIVIVDSIMNPASFLNLKLILTVRRLIENNYKKFMFNIILEFQIVEAYFRLRKVKLSPKR